MKNLLLLHGALASKSQFDQTLPLLRDEFDAEAINLSGHGGTIINPAGYSFNVFADDILKQLDSKGIDKANLFGFSMGGYAALYFARQHPDRVERIFTFNVKFKWDMDSTQKEIAMLNAENMLLKVPTFANNLMVQHGINMWKNVLQTTSDMMVNLSRHHLLTDEDLERISCPVLLAVGDRDTTSGVAQTIDAWKKLPNAQLMVLPGTAHPYEKADPALLLAALRKFFLA